MSTQIPQHEGFGHPNHLNRSYSSSFSNGNGSTPKNNTNNNTLTGVEVSKSPPSKNLAHVPCKFFKQGACQAGSSCPFSHTMDSTVDTAPCKYFQKGNCKFGLKCALAHILPDGRRVNPKSLAQVYQSQQQQQQQQQNAGASGNHHLNGANGHNGNNSIHSGLNSNLNMNYYPSQTSIPSGSIPTPKMISPIHSNIQSSSSSFNPMSNTFDSTPHHHPRAFSSTSPLKSNMATSPFTSTSIWSTDPRYRSLSTSNTITRPIFTETINESAIIDDDDDDDNGDDEKSVEDELFEEDFVPSSLSDLLTPQELKRRGSRPGSNGVRPQFNKNSVSASGNAGEEDMEMQFKLEEDWING